MPNCPICDITADVSNQLCDVHNTTFEIKPVIIFGRDTGTFGIYTNKYLDGNFPIYIGQTKSDCKDFFYLKHDKLRQAMELGNQINFSEVTK